MWVSSPTAVTTVPVAPRVCVKLTPGRGGFESAVADAAKVTAVNLRTYRELPHVAGKV